MRIVNGEQMRNIDSNAINNYGIPGIVLMENAALAVVDEIEDVLKADEKLNYQHVKVLMMVGKGNNGGDGMAVARHLTVRGMDVTVFLFARFEEITGDARVNFLLFEKMGGKIICIEEEKQLRLFKLALLQAQIAVDALFGTGFKGAIPDLAGKFVEEINNYNIPVIAVDIPSGLEANTGKVHKFAIKANTTVTFGLPKLGHFIGSGPEYSGKIVVNQISIPEHIISEEKISTFLLTDKIIKPLIPERNFQAHKGMNGRGVLVGGSTGMSGAVILAGRSALRCGIGLLQIVVPEKIANNVDAGVVEAIIWPTKDKEVLGMEAWSTIAERLTGANVCAIGPGLKQSEAFLLVLDKILKETEIPLVLDADALNLMACKPELLTARKGKGSLVLTPHPGEMARLCSCTIREVQDNRLKLALSKAMEWGAIVVLKGSSTVIASPDGRAFINSTGNPGLGSGGTGDVLTGAIMSWIAQGVPPLGAACLGVYLHGLAGDCLKDKYGVSGFTASEVADMLPEVRKKIELGKDKDASAK
ncbi:MAG: NAD(P)H-hydrate dehydratase [Eubacteriales bacterium]